MNDIANRCKQVMAEVLEVNIDDINDETNPDTVDQWDSLAHVQLVLKLEKEFNIKISPEDGIEYFTSYTDIVSFLVEKV